MNADLVNHIAGLANIPVTQSEAEELAKSFSETLTVIERLKEVDVTNVEPTHQVTGLENQLRADIVDETRMFTQTEALAGAKRTHNGFFVVDQVIDDQS